ncbi:hypothetical protein EJ08DRAFT_738970 [Tothia fuscella]|uniref:Uncharacterized protein n=1 Tax=Tothia fuscella TaxID=1048955 RepID=A0A9P4NFI0_9PEZI|nr:hypothetical protein EJ08DRAFT_738970 [Tothia fuscella]
MEDNLQQFADLSVNDAANTNPTHDEDVDESFPFLVLPPELRNKTYEVLLEGGWQLHTATPEGRYNVMELIDGDIPLSDAQSTKINLTQANHRIHDEMTTLYTNEKLYFDFDRYTIIDICKWQGVIKDDMFDIEIQKKKGGVEEVVVKTPYKLAYVDARTLRALIGEAIDNHGAKKEVGLGDILGGHFLMTFMLVVGNYFGGGEYFEYETELNEEDVGTPEMSKEEKSDAVKEYMDRWENSGKMSQKFEHSVLTARVKKECNGCGKHEIEVTTRFGVVKL